MAGVEQSLCASGTMGRRGLRLRGAVGWVRSGGTGVVFKGRSRGSRARLGKGIPGGFAGELGHGVALESERKGRGRC